MDAHQYFLPGVFRSGGIKMFPIHADLAVAVRLQPLIPADMESFGRQHDCQHIAAAVVTECNCIISWNFKHIVNIKTIHGVRAITNLTGYKTIDILSPTVLLESEG